MAANASHSLRNDREERARPALERPPGMLNVVTASLGTISEALMPADGTSFVSTVLAEVTPSMLLCREETFGPVAGLAAYVFTRDADRATRVSETLEHGMVGINTGLIPTELAPLGGMGESRLDREGSITGSRNSWTSSSSAAASGRAEPAAGTRFVDASWLCDHSSAVSGAGYWGEAA